MSLTINTENLRYPADGIKGAKDITGNLQKLFADYQKIYGENCYQIKNLLG